MKEKSSNQIIVEAVTRGVEDAMRTVANFVDYGGDDEFIDHVRDNILRVATEHANRLAESYKAVTAGRAGR